MATNKNTTGEASAPVDERVEVFVPKGGALEEPNLFISVNGENYLLPRGKKSKVPRHIAEEFLRAQKAQEALDERIDQLVAAGEDPVLRRK